MYLYKQESFAGDNFNQFHGFGTPQEIFNHKNFIEYGGVIINGRVISANGDSVGIMDVTSLSLARQHLSNSNFSNRHIDMVASINNCLFIAF